MSADISRYAIAPSKYKDSEKCQEIKTANKVSNVIRLGIEFFGIVEHFSAL